MEIFFEEIWIKIKVVIFVYRVNKEKDYYLVIKLI